MRGLSGWLIFITAIGRCQMGVRGNCAVSIHLSPARHPFFILGESLAFTLDLQTTHTYDMAVSLIRRPATGHNSLASSPPPFARTAGRVPWASNLQGVSQRCWQPASPATASAFAETSAPLWADVASCGPTAVRQAHHNFASQTYSPERGRREAIMSILRSSPATKDESTLSPAEPTPPKRLRRPDALSRRFP